MDVDDGRATRWMKRLHDAGYGITFSWYADDDAVAVVLWRGAQPVGSASAESLAEALELAEDQAEKVA